MQPIRSKFIPLAGALALAALCSTGLAQAQTSSNAMRAPSTNDATPAPLNGSLLQAHKTDLEAMITDLSRVQTPAAAKEYEPYLAAQLPKYVQNHKALHHGALPGFHLQKVRLAGPALAQQQQLADAADKLSDTHFPKVASEMDRVERLNPSLKKSFDTLRSLD